MSKFLGLLASGFVFLMTSPTHAEGDAPIDQPVPDKASELVRARLQDMVGQHPSIGQARQDYCVAVYAEMQERTAYYPRLDAAVSGGNKLVDKTTRGDEFGGTSAPEYDGKGVNFSLTLNQQIYDWGKTGAAIDKSRALREAAQLEGLVAQETQLYNFFKLAIHLSREDRLTKSYEKSVVPIQKEIAALEARFKAGAGRISDVRAVRIIGLDIETLVQSAINKRTIVARNILHQFEVDEPFVNDALHIFRQSLGNDQIVVDVRETLQWRIKDADLRAATHDFKRLSADRFPVIKGVLQGQAWDVTEENTCGDVLASTHPDAAFYNGKYRRYENCNTYELTGRLELSMPLYDGGLNRAQKSKISAQRRSIEAEIRALERTHISDTQRVQETLRDALMRRAQQNAKVEDLRMQLESEAHVQGKTRSDPLQLAGLLLRFAQTQADLITVESEVELARLEAFFIAHRLTEKLGLIWETSGC